MSGSHAAARNSADYRDTLYLPKTSFPMRARLPEREPERLRTWKAANLFATLRERSAGRPRFVLHDGPPYANGPLHLGHALNKIAKDIINRTWQMQGFDANYVPGWDCHGLPIEWKVEENLREQGREKADLSVRAFRGLCRDFAEGWVREHKAGFERIGVLGDWDQAYTSMSYASEATIAQELLKFAATGQLYRGSKPVMWSVVEQTALAEAEIEFHDVESPVVWVRFPVRGRKDESIAIWTTTPWTIPGNRAICYAPDISYGLYAWKQDGSRDLNFLHVADARAEALNASIQGRLIRERDVPSRELATLSCHHPFHQEGFDFDVPLLAGKHVTDAEGTGFVHTAPGHGREDFEIWQTYAEALRSRGVSTSIPETVDADGMFTSACGFLQGARVIDEHGAFGDANDRVVAALDCADNLLASGKIGHQYPHSWRSKKRVIFRNTPQWFIHMDRPIDALGGRSLRALALSAIANTAFVPSAGQHRLQAMVADRPDWVVSRQRAWGVPISVFVSRETGQLLCDPVVDARIVEAFRNEGADVWFDASASARFLLPEHDPEAFEKVEDILDVWFESGASHAYVLEARSDLGSPATLYLEGTDQHRGWFQSSLLEASGTRGRAPFDTVLTHGFLLDASGRKLSKSTGAGKLDLETILKSSGAEILRLWVASTDISTDVRVGTEILRTATDTYRKLRNTLRWLLGTLAAAANETGRWDQPIASLPRLERYILHQMARLDEIVRSCTTRYAMQELLAAVSRFAIVDLSAFYFDIRKDCLYCDPPSSQTRLACLWVLDHVFRRLCVWLAPVLCFTADEAWAHRYGEASESVHLQVHPETASAWIYRACDPALADVDCVDIWEDDVPAIRQVVLGAFEVARQDRKIGASLEARVEIFLENWPRSTVLRELDWAELTIASQAQISTHAPEINESGSGCKRIAEASRTFDGNGEERSRVTVHVYSARGRKCARSWRYCESVGTDPEFPDVSARDAQALREKMNRQVSRDEHSQSVESA